MVCTLGRGRMAALVRLLKTTSTPEVTPVQESIHEEISVQAIRRIMSGADEANLLEEEEMHVFDCRPLTDPLHLVRCNACKKPIKASQYAAHAERCRSLNSLEDTVLEIDGGSGFKKPQQKGTISVEGTDGNNRLTTGGQDGLEFTDGNDAAAPELTFHGQCGIFSTQSGEAKIDAPVPLATKIYHSQGNHRLRRALGYLYHGASGKELNHDCSSPEAMRGKSMVSSEVPLPRKSLHVMHTESFSQKICRQKLVL